MIITFNIIDNLNNFLNLSKNYKVALSMLRILNSVLRLLRRY